MNKETRYRYEQRIRALEAENYRLREFKRVLRNVADGIADVVADDKKISQGWILKQINQLLGL